MAEGATIKAIEASSVHQIQSGQVIVDLCSVAKELVENSLDAGATTIEVRFKNQGLDCIEVQDNGSGIAPQNYESLALKHYTSKLSSYSDLDTLDTFGFRGEALSSLCALSHFTVTTCLTSVVPKGTRLEFETSGKLRGTSVVAAQKGTTVSVETLFYNLPVRRRELERNIKREWGKVVNLLNQYACVRTGIKFTVTQQPNKGRRTTLFATKGNTTTRENIVNVFGAKTMTALLALDLELDLELTAGGPSILATSAKIAQSTKVRVCGHVSRPARGEGRQTPDRQMFYVNGRPCALPQFAKVFNEVYRSYNSTQSPFIFADIQLDTHLYDVNVSPDKRTILLHDQGRMLDTMREALIELFEMQDVTVPVSQLSAQKQARFKTPTLGGQLTPVSNGRHRASSPVNQIDDDMPTADRLDVSIMGPDTSDVDVVPGASDAELGKTSDGSVSSEWLAGDAQGPKLVSKWAERKSEARSETTSSAGLGQTAAGGEGGLSNNLERLLSKLRGEDASAGQPGANEHQDNRMQQAGDTGEAVEGQQPKDHSDPPVQPPIPAICPPKTQSPRPGPPEPAWRPFKRSSPEPAIITIGDRTTPNMKGLSSAKRQKTDVDPHPGRSGATKARPGRIAKAPLPSFGGRLSQMFAAASERSGGTGNSPGSGLLPVATEEIEDERTTSASHEDQESDPGSDDGHESPCLPDAEAQFNDGGEGDALFVADAPAAESGADESEAETTWRLGADEQLPLEEVHPSRGQSACCGTDHDDDVSVEEDEKPMGEEPPVLDGVAATEKAANEPSEEGEKRSRVFLKGGSKRKDSTLQLVQSLSLDEQAIDRQLRQWQDSLTRASPLSLTTLPQAGDGGPSADGDGLDAETANAEQKLSLTINKSDFGRMKIVGQFNLGFVLAVREASGNDDDDELFIIDQHASDEKYNFERLQADTVVQSQRLVRPKTLDLTALEEEILVENQAALEANGFSVEVDDSGSSPVGSRCRLLSLPLSRETTFSLADLQELIALLADNPTPQATTVPRPSRVRSMFAMRACRSSIMVGKALSRAQMAKVVRHMGEMDKPWNCPHGRPTMRHLCGLGAAWDRGKGWREGDGLDEGTIPVDWDVYSDH